jgi:hypothetical protein
LKPPIRSCRISRYARGGDEYLIAAFESGERAVIADALGLLARLKAELTHAFAALDSTYQPLDAQTVIGRGRHPSGG